MVMPQLMFRGYIVYSGSSYSISSASNIIGTTTVKKISTGVVSFTNPNWSLIAQAYFPVITGYNAPLSGSLINTADRTEVRIQLQNGTTLTDGSFLIQIWGFGSLTIPIA